MGDTKWVSRGFQVPSCSIQNEITSRKCFEKIKQKLRRKEDLKIKYEKIIHEYLEQSMVKKAPEQPTAPSIFYMPHKPMTKVRMVFGASGNPHPLANSVNECMYTGPLLQPLLWDIMVRAWKSTHLLLVDLKKAFLQIEIKEEYRDAFPFLFNINGREEHLHFARVPFGAEARLFMLGATLQHHFNKQSQAYEEMIESLEENTYMDNLMKTGSDIRELSRFKEEAIEILQNAKFPVHKWESDVQQLDKEPNQSKILGLIWDKRKDTLEIQVKMRENSSVTKWSIQSQLSAINFMTHWG